MASYGGARPGAGRKKGQKSNHTLEAERMKERLVFRFSAKADELADALLARSLGHYQEKEIFGKKTIVYKTAPDVQAIKESFDRSMGRVKEQLELGGVKDNPIEVSIRNVITKVYGDK